MSDPEYVKDNYVANMSYLQTSTLCNLKEFELYNSDFFVIRLDQLVRSESELLTDMKCKNKTRT